MARYLERMENHRNTGWRHELLHLLYRPANLGRMNRYRVRVPLLHSLHLIPGRWMNAACDRYERRHPLQPGGVVVPPEPPIEFTAAPKMHERELEALRRRPHP